MKTSHNQCCVDCSCHITLCMIVNRFKIIMDMLGPDFTVMRRGLLPVLKIFWLFTEEKLQKKILLNLEYRL